jgi:hypothetical protein
MSEQHNAAHLSPDGQWQWNGSQWVPAQQVTPAPGGPAAPRSRRKRRWPWFAGGAGLLVLGMAVCSAAVSNSGSGSGTQANRTTATTAASEPAAAAPQPATPKPATPKPAAPAESAVLLDLSGSGIKNSSEFSAPSHWKLNYTYDCANFGGQGNFQVYVMEGDSTAGIPVNELGANGSSSSDVYHSGKVHLEMNSECNWHVTAST